MEPAAPAKPKVDTPFLNVDEAAEYTGLSVGTIYNAQYTGRLAKQPGTRRVLLRREDLLAFLGTKPPKKRRRS